MLSQTSERSKLDGQVGEGWATWTPSGAVTGVLLTSQIFQVCPDLRKLNLVTVEEPSSHPCIDGSKSSML